MATPAPAPLEASFLAPPPLLLPLDHPSLLPEPVSFPTTNALPSAKRLPSPPPLPPRKRHLASPPPPSQAYQVPPKESNPTPQPPPLSESPNSDPSAKVPKGPGPPPMLINGSTSSGQGLSSPSLSRSDQSPSSSNHIAIGLISGISIALAATLFIIVPVLVWFCHRRKQKRVCHDFECPPPKDNSYAALPQHVIKKIPTPGDPAVQVSAKHLLLPREVSSGTAAISDCESHFSPRGFGNVFGFSAGNFTYEELVLATRGFSEANLLGEGGFGYVHKGILPTGRVVAVKQLKIGSRQGEREFQAEVETITRVHHRHLVSLVGYCITGIKRLLVYEFVPNKTLEFHLHGTREPVMNWATRLKIALGSAKGLAYLHEDCNPTIIHRDIKASNILLDSNFEAMVSDFGLAKFFSDANHCVSHVSTRVVGTFGYLAPEYAQSGKASDKSDVFSYGVVLLELITGQPPILEPESSTCESLVTWARPLLSQALENGEFAAVVDPRLEGNFDKEELANMVACAAACVRHSTRRRPRMSQITRALEGGISLEDLDEGIRPGQSTVYNFNYGSGNFLRDISKLRMTFASEENFYKSSGDSSNEDDHHPSDSSSDSKTPLQR